MTKVESIISMVSNLQTPEVEAVLGAALPTADPLAQETIVKYLWQRHGSRGQIEIIRHYHCFHHDLKKTIQANSSLLTSELTLLVTEGSSQTMRNGLMLIRDAHMLDMAYLLPHALRSPHPLIQELAAQILLAFALDLKQPSAPNTLETLHQALVQALHSYQGHRQSQVLQALAILGPGALEKAAEVLSDPRHLAVTDLRKLLEEAQEPWIRQALVMFFLVPTLTQSALAGFRRVRLEDQHLDVFTHPQLLLLPRMRTVFSGLRHGHELLIPPSQYARLSEAQQLDYALWLEHLPLTPSVRLQALENLAILPEPRARLAALRTILAMTHGSSAQEACRSLAQYHQDPCPAIALLALGHLLRLRWPELLRLLPKLINSPHAQVRHWATEHLAPIAFDRLWAAWPRLSEKQKLAAGAAQIKFDPNFHRRLGERLIARTSVRLRSLGMIATLGQGRHFERPLLHLVEDADAKVAASAARGLGSTSLPPDPPSPLVQAALEKSLHHPDARTRANAVEALDQLGASDHTPRLLEMARTDVGRPRANAIKALLRLHHPQAPAAIGHMLADPHAQHRIRALWVIQTMNLLDEARQVACMSLTDPDPQVRQHAETVIQQLLDTPPPIEIPPTPASVCSSGGSPSGSLAPDSTPGQFPAGDRASAPAPGPAALARPPVLAPMIGLAWAAAMPESDASAATLLAAEVPNQRWLDIAMRLTENFPQNYVSLSLTALWFLLLLVALILGGVKLAQYLRHPQEHTAPLLNFWSLAASLGISWSDRRLLIHIAHRENLPSPLTLLLSPATLEYHGRSYACRCQRRRRIEERLARLRRQLFET